MATNEQSARAARANRQYPRTDDTAPGWVEVAPGQWRSLGDEGRAVAPAVTGTSFKQPLPMVTEKMMVDREKRARDREAWQKCNPTVDGDEVLREMREAKTKKARKQWREKHGF